MQRHRSSQKSIRVHAIRGILYMFHTHITHYPLLLRERGSLMTCIRGLLFLLMDRRWIFMHPHSSLATSKSFIFNRFQMNSFFSNFLSKRWGFKAMSLSSKDLKHYYLVTSKMRCESSYSRCLVGISLHLRKWNVCIVCDKTASGNSPWSVCKPREASKYPQLALKHQTHCWISLESIRWEPAYWKTSRVQSGLPMLKKHNNKMNVRRTYPVFGEVDPQRVVQLIEQFHKFLPLWGQED